MNFFSQHEEATTQTESPDLTQELAEAKNEITSLKAQLDAREVDGELVSFDDVVSKMRSYQKKCVDLEKQVSTKNQELKDAEKIIQSLKQTREQNQVKIADSDKKLKEALDAQEEYKSTIEALQEQISKMTEKAAEKEKSVEDRKKLSNQTEKKMEQKVVKNKQVAESNKTLVVEKSSRYVDC